MPMVNVLESTIDIELGYKVNSSIGSHPPYFSLDSAYEKQQQKAEKMHSKDDIFFRLRCYHFIFFYFYFTYDSS
jgi:hypothetical protein